MTPAELRARAAELRNLLTPIAIAAVEIREAVARIVDFADGLLTAADTAELVAAGKADVPSAEAQARVTAALKGGAR